MAGRFPRIETQRLRLRPPRETDLDNWAVTVFGDPEVVRYMPKRDMTPRVRAERAKAVYDGLWEKHGFGGWLITQKMTGALVGHCELEYLEETDEVELGYALGRAHWGKGVATEAARAAVRLGFEAAGLSRIMAVVVPENVASYRVLEHIGFAYEETARYYDLEVVYYSITPGQFQHEDSLFRVTR